MAIQKPKVTRKESRLNYAEFMEEDGIGFWTRPELPEVPFDNDDQYYMAKNEDRIDSISRAKLQNDRKWWILAHVNSLNLLPNELNPSLKLRIPFYRTIWDVFDK